MPPLHSGRLDRLTHILSAQRQVMSFRVKELQECLERLGMKKQGAKPELQARVLALFTDSSAL